MAVGQETISDDPVITILFTDIVEFSTISEDRNAAEVARLINQDFALMVTCIEAKGGTADKFIGDSVMTFWGAPEDSTAMHNVPAAQQSPLPTPFMLTTR